MNLLRTMSSAVLAPALAAAFTLGISAQQAKITTPEANHEKAAAPTWTSEQLITASVHDAWLLSGKNEATFFEMVTQLADLSASKRSLTLPDNAAAGRRLGEYIKLQARMDTSQLLYVVVDKAVQRIGTHPKP